jgi:hypothetical protein
MSLSASRYNIDTDTDTDDKCPAMLKQTPMSVSILCPYTGTYIDVHMYAFTFVLRGGKSSSDMSFATSRGGKTKKMKKNRSSSDMLRSAKDFGAWFVT